MTILKHPLIADRLTSLRNKDSNSQEFRSFLRNIATLMVAEVTADLETTAQGVETPIEETKGRRISMPVVLVPVPPQIALATFTLYFPFAFHMIHVCS